ncbi:alpha/beta hydrolase fold protein [Xylariomycetidae sp. FL2044]|nr:alpha/beta hydrolase fold protein [Xylariomycetidae sp. FL2044]
MASNSIDHKHPPYSVLSRVYYATSVSAIQGLVNSLMFLRDWNQWMYPPESAPSLVKYYECRPNLPVRIFFPKAYDQTSPQTLPTLIDVHGGGFCIGTAADDDEVAASLADKHNFLVISVSYRKAPWYPFPTAIHDVEALMLAVHADESLPIDKSRIAVIGYSAGANLSLAACQLPSIRETIKPKAVIPVYAVVDVGIPSSEKCKSRFYKPGLIGLRGAATDYLDRNSPTIAWSYVRTGQDYRDPLLSPYFAPRDALPPHIFFVSTELDQLAHEGWRMASKLAGRPIPELSDKVGKEEQAAQKGALILDDERFAFEHIEPDGNGSVRWLLIPDALHGFDHLPVSWVGEEGFQDARVKTEAYQKIIAEWLYNVVWKP